MALRVQSAMNYLLFYTQPTKTTSIGTQLDNNYTDILNTNTKTITKMTDTCT